MFWKMYHVYKRLIKVLDINFKYLQLFSTELQQKKKQN